MAEHALADDVEQLAVTLGDLIAGARTRSVAAVNAEMVQLHWQLGRHIVEFEQGGAARATYGTALLDTLAARSPSVQATSTSTSSSTTAS